MPGGIPDITAGNPPATGGLRVVPGPSTMDDPYVKLGWKILRALPKDDSDRTYEAVLAVHSLVWKLWQMEVKDGGVRDSTGSTDLT